MCAKPRRFITPKKFWYYHRVSILEYRVSCIAPREPQVETRRSALRLKPGGHPVGVAHPTPFCIGCQVYALNAEAVTGLAVEAEGSGGSAAVRFEQCDFEGFDCRFREKF